MLAHMQSGLHTTSPPQFEIARTLRA